MKMRHDYDTILLYWLWSHDDYSDLTVSNLFPNFTGLSVYNITDTSRTADANIYVYCLYILYETLFFTIFQLLKRNNDYSVNIQIFTAYLG